MKTILFDLDGTIIDSAEGITAGVEYALSVEGLPPLPYETRLRFVGPPLRSSFVRYCGVDAEKAEQLLAEYRKYYSEKGVYQCTPYPGMESLLKTLGGRGYELMVATAKPTEFAKTILENLNLAGYFQEIVGASMDKNRDSKEKIIAICAEKAKYKNIFMVGDTFYDVHGARANNIPAVGVLYGFGDHEELRASDPAYIVNTVEEIGEVL